MDLASQKRERERVRTPNHARLWDLTNIRGRLLDSAFLFLSFFFLLSSSGLHHKVRLKRIVHVHTIANTSEGPLRIVHSLHLCRTSSSGRQRVVVAFSNTVPTQRPLSQVMNRLLTFGWLGLHQLKGRGQTRLCVQHVSHCEATDLSLEQPVRQLRFHCASMQLQTNPDLFTFHRF